MIEFWRRIHILLEIFPKQDKKYENKKVNYVKGPGLNTECSRENIYIYTDEERLPAF